MSCRAVWRGLSVCLLVWAGVLTVCGVYGCGTAARQEVSAGAARPESPDAAIGPDDPLPLAPKDAGAQPATDRLYPVSIKGKAGYINALGDVVIPPQWDFAHDFQEGLARVGFIKKVGAGYEYTTHFIDETGQIVIENVRSPELGAADFSEGLAPFLNKSGKVGYMDRTGQVVIPAQFWCEPGTDDCGCSCESGAAGPFVNGIAWAKVGHLEVLIDKKGRRLAKGDAIRGQASRYSQDRVPFKQNGLVGYKNMLGEVVIPAQFASGGEFVNGYASVTPRDMSDVYTYIDKHGRQICDQIFDYAHDFSEGYGIGFRHIEGGSEYSIVAPDGTVTKLPENIEPHHFGFAGGLLMASIATPHQTKTANTSESWTETQLVFLNPKGEITARFRPSDHHSGKFGDQIQTPYDGHLAQIFNQDEVRSYWVNGRGEVVWADSEEADESKG